MAYRYDRQLLEMNRELVEQLLKIGKEEDRYSVAYDTPQEVRAARYFINELLATIVFYRPECAEVRNRIRTWIRYGEGRWHLFVGRPDRPIPGGLPKINRSPKLGTVTNGGSPGVGAWEVSEFRFSTVIRDEQTWDKFLWHLVNSGKNVQVARAEFGFVISNADALQVEGWTSEITSPTSALWRRK